MHYRMIVIKRVPYIRAHYIRKTLQSRDVNKKEQSISYDELLELYSQNQHHR